MITLSSALKKFSLAAEVVPEYEGPDLFSEIKEQYEGLLQSYPQLKNYSAYLEFLRLTGGAHIHNENFSLGLYGFGGYVVASFDEGLFLDQDRYFIFGEVLYTMKPEPVYFFAFDLQSNDDKVYASPDEKSEYNFCSPSFTDLLLEFTNGKYPALDI